MQDVTKLLSVPAAGLDVGATKTHMRFVAPGATEPQSLTLRTADYASLEDLFVGAFTQAGCLPKRVVAGVAGRIQNNGDTQVTNHGTWPVFKYKSFVETTGIELRLVNDLYSQLAGIVALHNTGRIALTPELPEPEVQSKLVMAMGSGIGGAFMDPKGMIHPAEPGHISWQPNSDIEFELLRGMQSASPGRAITMEETISGLHGWDRLYDFVSQRVKPGDAVLAQVEQLRADNEPVGPAVSVGALADDPCCVAVLELYGSLAGRYLRDIALVTMAEAGGAIYLSGSVMQANRGGEMLFAKTAFRENFISKGSAFDSFLATVPFYLVTDDHVAVKGAYELAAHG